MFKTSVTRIRALQLILISRHPAERFPGESCTEKKKGTASPEEAFNGEGFRKQREGKGCSHGTNSRDRCRQTYETGATAGRKEHVRENKIQRSLKTVRKRKENEGGPMRTDE